jgi:uncharacterized protein
MSGYGNGRFLDHQRIIQDFEPFSPAIRIEGQATFIKGSNSLNFLKIAVVGSGIAGLSAAWLLSQRHNVTLIEADKRIGGHTNTIDCPTPEGAVPVDTGFIVYNNATYPNLSALFEYLNVPTSNSDMGFGVSLNAGAYEYSGAGIYHLLGHASNLANPRHWRMMRDLVRFFRTAAAQVKNVGEAMSLGQFLSEHGYSKDFTSLHLLPVAGAIWSAAPQQMLDYPAGCFLRFFENHGLLNFYDRPQWRTVTGGSREYVQRLIADSRMQIVMNCAVKRIERSGLGVTLHGADDFRETFDHVVIASHADQALAMIADPTPNEVRGLSAFQYASNRAVLHRDASLMPRRKRLWSSWNYVSDGDADIGSSAVTYWMNALQPLATKTNLFVTLNPSREPLAGTVEREFEYTHPIFNGQTSEMQKRLWSLQGQNRTWFSGAHFGSGFHEDGLQSGLAVAEQLGGALRPWNIANQNGRIHVAPIAPEPKPKHLEAAE